MKGEDRKKTTLVYGKGKDTHTVEATTMSGKDADASAISDQSSFSKRRFQFSDKNKTITTFKIDDGKQIFEFRKVQYSWGGLYYFRDSIHSITENLFRLYTGEK